MGKKKDIFESYKLAIEARNFHYDNFNKWMTFYYVAIGAILVAFYTINKDNNQLRLILILLGFIISVLWHLSCKGYYFWILNWIHIIIKYERRLDKNQRIYSVFSKEVNDKKDKVFHPLESANVSTSKVTLIFSFVVCIVWSYLLVDDFADKCYSFWVKLILAIFSVYVLILIIWRFVRSDLSGHKMIKCLDDND